MAEKLTLEQALEKIKTLEQAKAELKTQLADTQKGADEAIAAYNALKPKSEETFEAEVKAGKVEINFGVDFEGKYYSKADLVESPKVLEALLKIGSAAVTKL